MSEKYHSNYHLNPVGLRGNLRHNEPMSKHTSWRVGGVAEWFYEPADLADLAALCEQLPADIPIEWVGLGSNLLVRDGGVKGLVILTAGLLNELNALDEHSFYVEAGVSCAKVARNTVRAGLTGAEFLAGIPGTMGGALAMNAGAWGYETWNIVRSVKTLDRYGVYHHRTAADYVVSYREVKRPQEEWFVSAILQLTPDESGDGQRAIRALLHKRNQTQPTSLPTCGSVFRNPTGDHAARLIEAAGLKNYQIGGACVSEKHANFIVNQGHATAADIEQLIAYIQHCINTQYDIQLIPEVHMIGEPSSE